MFEQLVRPFASRTVTTTRRIVPIKVDETPDEAKIAWGTTGSLPTGVVQPKATNLENIESVGFNLRGNIDNFHQSSREPDFVDVPIRDSGGNEIGTVTLDRAKSITYNNKNMDPQKQFGYLQNQQKPFTYQQSEKFKMVVVAPRDAPTATTPTGSGIRSAVPSNNVSQRTDTYVYP